MAKYIILLGCLGLLAIFSMPNAIEFPPNDSDYDIQEMGLENWNKSRIYHFFFFLNNNPCNAMYVTLGIADAQCTLRCLNVGSQIGGFCENGQCRCNMFTNPGGK